MCCRSSSRACRMTLAGTPATSEPGGTCVPWVTTAPAATIEPAPMCAPFMTTLPMPTSTSSSIRAPCRTTRCPTVTPRPTTSGKPGSECSVQPSWMLEPSPISMTSPSARATAPYQMLARGPMPQPDWLIDRDRLAHRLPPRVRARELWRVPPEFLAEAQDDATLVAIRAQEEAGLDILTDGEIRRESYSNHFATALDGVDIDDPGTALDRSGHPNPVPRVVGPIRRPYPVQVRDLEFLRSLTDRPVKITVPGPFTMSQQAQVEHYADAGEAAMDYAAAVNAEIKDLFAAGADLVQIDEPYMQARPDAAREYGVAALQRALEGVTGRTAVHICFGYAAIIHERPSGYSFLAELADVPAQMVSIETAQSGLDLGVLRDLSDKTIILGV